MPLKHYLSTFYSLFRKKLWLLVGILLSLIGVGLGFSSYLFHRRGECISWVYPELEIQCNRYGGYVLDESAIISFIIFLIMIMVIVYLYEHNKVLGKRALFLTLLGLLVGSTGTFGIHFPVFLLIFVSAGCLLWSIVDDYRKGKN